MSEMFDSLVSESKLYKLSAVASTVSDLTSAKQRKSLRRVDLEDMKRLLRGRKVITLTRKLSFPSPSFRCWVITRVYERKGRARRSEKWSLTRNWKSNFSPLTTTVIDFGNWTKWWRQIKISTISACCCWRKWNV